MGRRERVCRRGSRQQPFLSLWKRSSLLIRVFSSRFDPLSAKMQFFVKTLKKIKSRAIRRVEKMRNGAKVRRFYPKNSRCQGEDRRMRSRTNMIRETRLAESGENPEPTSAMLEGVLLLSVAILLLLFGLAILFSTSASSAGVTLFFKQTVWAIAGILVAGGCVLVGYRTLSNNSLLFLILLVILLLLPVTVMRRAVNGAYRWIIIGPLRIQPSEFAKVVLVLFCANFIAHRSRALETAPFKKIVLPLLGVIAVLAVLVMMGRDLGTTALLVALFFALLWSGGLPAWYVLPLPLLGIAGFFFIHVEWIQKILSAVGILNDYRLKRLTSYQNPQFYANDEGFQLWQSLKALGSGGWFGLGLTDSRFKRNYLPEAHTDFILSIAGEELGFVALIVVMFFYLLLTLLGFIIAYKARTRQGRIIAFGMSAFIGLQAFINIGVICGALPTKGMPAPLISYGGSNLLTCLAAVGLIFSVALDTVKPDYADRIREQFFAFFKRKRKKKEGAVSGS